MDGTFEWFYQRKREWWFRIYRGCWDWEVCSSVLWEREVDETLGGAKDDWNGEINENLKGLHTKISLDTSTLS